MPSNIIGGKHQISKDLWALSLVRKANAEHAYLILEGMDEKDENRIIMDAHLVIKAGTNDKKAQIIRRDLDINDAKTADTLQEIGQSCSYYTWSISKERAAAFIALVEAEKKRDINYVFLGKTALAGKLGGSLEASNSGDSKDSLEKNSNSSSMDSLLRDGHNCVSWAQAMVQAMQLKYTASWLSFVAVIPSNEVRGRQEPSTGCLIM